MYTLHELRWSKCTAVKLQMIAYRIYKQWNNHHHHSGYNHHHHRHRPHHHHHHHHHHHPHHHLSDWICEADLQCMDRHRCLSNPILSNPVNLEFHFEIYIFPIMNNRLNPWMYPVSDME